MMTPTPSSVPESPYKTMQGWIHSRAGQPNQVLTLSSELPIPDELVEEEALVKISHASLNPGASVIMQLIPGLFRTKPSVPEMDFSGTIVKLGRDTRETGRLKVKTEVFGSVPVGAHVRAGKGSLAQYVVVSCEALYLKPESLPFEQAAGLPIAGCTALALLDAAKIKNGSSVLVNGASGGIGSLFLQMAKQAVGETGKVVAICSGTNIEMVKDLGADEVRNTLPSLRCATY
jgi:NADPH:quinone reductase-like Zn-dependent oxidoreductase